MSDRPTLTPEGLVPLVAGLGWLAVAFASGPLGFVVASLPGIVLVGSGAALTLFPGDRRILHFAAAGGAVGMVLSLFALAWLGLAHGLVLGALSLGAALAAGFASLRLEPPTADIPAPQTGLALAAKVALDEAFMAHLQLSLKLPSRPRLAHMVGEVREALALFEERGFLRDPLSYHRDPPPLLEPSLQPRSQRGVDFCHLSFASEFEPRADEPGRERWLAQQPVRTAHAWVLRHEGEPRPWLVCINGYRMGFPLADLRVFDVKRYHEDMGFNLLMPVLPLHGPRKVGRQSGDRFFDGTFVDLVHASTQAMWDIRRLLSWVRREQGDPAIGVYGLSLGGYNASLLASVEPGLACAIAGIPLTDIGSIFWHHGSPILQRDMEQMGLHREELAQLLRVVSPLDLSPRLDAAACTVFGGIADRIVPASQVRDLAAHWKAGRVVWFQGAHLSFMREAGVETAIRETLEEHLRPAW